MRRDNHRSVSVAGVGGHRFEVDAGIAPLIRQCVRLGLWTKASCEGDPASKRRTAQGRGRRAWIGFGSTISAALFVTYGSRVRGDLDATEWSIVEWEGGCEVHFPKADIPRATRALARARRHATTLVEEHAS